MRQDKISYIPKEHKNLFSNWFTLKLNTDAIEENYEQKIRSNKIFMIIYLVLQTIILSTGIILNFKLSLDTSQSDYLVVEYYGYVCCVMLLVSYILFFIQLKIPQIANPFLYLNFITLKMIVLYFHEYMKFYLGVYFYEYDRIIYSSYYSIILCYFLFFDNNFIRLFTAAIINFFIYGPKLI